LLMGIALKMEERFVDVGMFIFEEGEPCSEVFLILAGTAILQRSEKNHKGQLSSRIVGKYSPGSLMGVLPFQVNPAHTSTCMAGPSGCKVAILSREVLQVLEAEDPRRASLVHRVFSRHVSLLTQIALGPAAVTSAGSVKIFKEMSVAVGAMLSDRFASSAGRA